MALSKDEQHILAEIERGLRASDPQSATLPRSLRTLIGVVVGLVAVVVVVTLIRSEAAGLTLLVGGGLLGVIGYLHRYNLRPPA
jgi:uncharacterized membrane protein YccC